MQSSYRQDASAGGWHQYGNLWFRGNCSACGLGQSYKEMMHFLVTAGIPLVGKAGTLHQYCMEEDVC